MLDLNAIGKTYQGRRDRVRAVQDVSLRLERGSVMALQGPSGCGKTTLLLMAGGLLAPDQGTVRVDGDEVYALDDRRRDRLRAEKIGFVFQQFHLVPYLNVVDNLLVPTLALGRDDAQAARRRADELIEQFGLLSRARHFPDELSTGERQRAALARALMNRPGLVLADEPTGNLDEGNAGAVLDAIEQYAQAGGAVLIASHDARVAARGHRVCRMEGGRLTTGLSALRNQGGSE